MIINDLGMGSADYFSEDKEFTNFRDPSLLSLLNQVSLSLSFDLKGVSHSTRYPSLSFVLSEGYITLNQVFLPLSFYLKGASFSTRYPSLSFFVSEGCITLNQVSLSLSLYLKRVLFSTRYPSHFYFI